MSGPGCRTKMVKGKIWISISGLNRIFLGYGKVLHGYLNRVLFIYGCWMIYQMGEFHQKYLMELGIFLIGSSLTFYLTIIYVSWGEALVVLCDKWIRIRPAHSLFWKKYSRLSRFGFKENEHPKGRLFSRDGHCHDYVLVMEHFDGYQKIATLTKEKCFAASSRLVNEAEKMEKKQDYGFSEDGKTDHDPFADRPGF